MNKFLFVALLLVTLLLLSGCTSYETPDAYFDLGIECETKENSCELQERCNTLCDTSGIRIRNYGRNNKVAIYDGKYICRCI